MSLVVTYLASPRNSSWRHWTRLDCLYASLALLKRHCLLPVIIFHEDYTQEDKDRLNGVGLSIDFQQVDFSTHSHHFKSLRPTERVGSYGYAMMCRFFSGVMQKHEALTPYTHYMRLDDDSYIVAPVSEVVLSRFESTDYVYSTTFVDPHFTLWCHTQDFLRSENLPIAHKYTDNVPYTNFHSASLAMWRHSVVERYVVSIEACHGCLCHGWDDAMIQAMLAFAILPAIGLSVRREKEFDYRHNQHCSHRGLHTVYCADGTSDSLCWGPPPLSVLT